MKKEEFVKIGVSEELAAACEKASLDELKDFVPRMRMNEVSEENKSLKKTVFDRDKQLEELKKSSGDNAELKKQIEALQEQNKTEKAEHEKELARLKLDNAIETALTAEKVKNNKALRALLDIEKIRLNEGGELSGLSEQLEAAKRSDGYLFAEKEKENEKIVFKGFQPAASGDVKPEGKTNLSSMTYSEMTAYLEQNPNVKIE